MMFNTSSGNYVISELLDRIKSAMSSNKKWPAKFNTLFALTYNLLEYDFWYYDNEIISDEDEDDDEESFGYILSKSLLKRGRRSWPKKVILISALMVNSHDLL